MTTEYVTAHAFIYSLQRNKKKHMRKNFQEN